MFDTFNSPAYVIEKDHHPLGPVTYVYQEWTEKFFWFPCKSLNGLFIFMKKGAERIVYRSTGATMTPVACVERVTVADFMVKR